MVVPHPGFLTRSGQTYPGHQIRSGRRRRGLRPNGSVDLAQLLQARKGIKQLPYGWSRLGGPLESAEGRLRERDWDATGRQCRRPRIHAGCLRRRRGRRSRWLRAPPPTTKGEGATAAPSPIGLGLRLELELPDDGDVRLVLEHVVRRSDLSGLRCRASVEEQDPAGGRSSLSAARRTGTADLESRRRLMSPVTPEPGRHLQQPVSMRNVVRRIVPFPIRRAVWRVRRNVPRLAQPLSLVVPTAAAARQPILLIGCPRSGTSILFQTLLRSPELRSVHSEGHILWQPYHHPRDKGWESDALGAEDVGEREREYIHLAVRLVVQNARFLDKTPKNCLRIPYLRSLFPDAKFVFLRRRAADNVSSLIEGWRARPRFVTYRLPERLEGLGRLSGNRWSFVLIPGWRELRNAPAWWDLLTPVRGLQSDCA